ncbi:ubiquinol-cytochrome C chaperone family protein [Sphingomonas flavalba]|uniref:ubiquinol-cytochrome C chaperone family protein n=1 Tax=Sphingomonas flavalba TaxID=2559804 RepID=UPI001EF08D77|nr:ubiquinol-cytochrome C chaperone family protein [Sphingomonas flavalba]
MPILDRLFRRRDDRSALVPLYHNIVTAARQPHWYREGAVPDTIDGRFDTLSTLLALVLLRLEDDPAARAETARLTELFVADMDGQLREIGIGDLVVGKHVGKMMGALGGRLGALRDGLAPDGAFADALVRNLWRGAPPPPAALAVVERRLRAFSAALAAADTQALLAGKLPTP